MIVDDVIATSNSSRVKPPYLLPESPITNPPIQLVAFNWKTLHQTLKKSLPYVYYEGKQGKPASVDGFPY